MEGVGGKGVSRYGFRRRRGEAEGWESWVGALWGFHSMGVRVSGVVRGVRMSRYSDRRGKVFA